MEYSIDSLAKLSGVTSRTLRHYDQIGLLAPLRKNSAGYRIYGPKELDRLQQILFYRELGMGLSDIRAVLDHPGFDRSTALRLHLSRLKEEEERLHCLVQNLQKTIRHLEEGEPMEDKEKFQGFKERKLRENEEKYGDEIREKYGVETVEASNRKFMDMTKAQHESLEALAAEILSSLAQAVRQGTEPASEAGAELARKHRDWLCAYWPSYSREAHLGLCQMYLDDARFTKYYDANQPGCAAFLQKAVQAWDGD